MVLVDGNYDGRKLYSAVAEQDAFLFTPQKKKNEPKLRLPTSVLRIEQLQRRAQHSPICRGFSEKDKEIKREGCGGDPR